MDDHRICDPCRGSTDLGYLVRMAFKVFKTFVVLKGEIPEQNSDK